MKNIRLLIVSALLGVTASSVLASTSLTAPAQFTAPVPLTVVHPTNLPNAYRNVTVAVQVTIDRNGVAHNVLPVGDMPKDLASRLMPAVSQWTFTPARNAKGEAVQKTVILPLTLVDGAI